MTKHHPATPLPWELDDENQVCASNTLVCRFDHIYEEMEGKDAAYIVHACNQYPRAIELLKQLAGSVSDIHGPHLVDFSAARQFLKEIGENKQ